MIFRVFILKFNRFNFFGEKTYRGKAEFSVIVDRFYTNYKTTGLEVFQLDFDTDLIIDAV